MLHKKTLAIGIDIGGTRTKISLVNLDVRQIEAMLITPTETKDGGRFPALIGDAIRQFNAKAVAGAWAWGRRTFSDSIKI